MSAQSLPVSTAHATHAGGPEDPDTHFHAILGELVDMGADIARRIHHAITAPAPDETPAARPDTSLTDAFDRIARTIRRTILLAQHLTQQRAQQRAQERAQERAEHLAEPAARRAAVRTVARKQILRRCEDNIDRAAFNGRRQLDTNTLRAELHDRLDRPELDDDIVSRPVADIVVDICRDLGLGLDDMDGFCPARRRTPDDIAELCDRAAAPAGKGARARLRELLGPPPGEEGSEALPRAPLGGAPPRPQHL